MLGVTRTWKYDLPTGAGQGWGAQLGRQTLHSEMVVTVMATEVSGGRWPIRRTAKNLAAGKLRAGNREAARQPWAGALGSPGTMVR